MSGVSRRCLLDRFFPPPSLFLFFFSFTFQSSLHAAHVQTRYCKPHRLHLLCFVGERQLNTVLNTVRSAIGCCPASVTPSVDACTPRPCTPRQHLKINVQLNIIELVAPKPYPVTLPKKTVTWSRSRSHVVPPSSRSELLGPSVLFVFSLPSTPCSHPVKCSPSQNCSCSAARITERSPRSTLFCG